VRIAWVVYGTLDRTTGGYVYDRIVVDALRRRGHEVRVHSFYPNDARHNDAIVRALVRSRDEVVVADELCHVQVAPLFRALSPRLCGPRRVLLVHHLQEWEDGRRRMSEVVCARLAHRIITTSRTSAERLHATLGVRARACLPGSDRLVRLPRSGRGGRPELLFVGTWTARKGLLELLEALVQLSALDFRLTVAGDPDVDRSYAARVQGVLASHPELASKVDLSGVVDDARLAELYARADLLVAPTGFEGYGMALTEALRAGLGVVVTDEGAVREAVGRGEHALFVPGRDASTLARALGALLVEPERCIRMQRAAERLRQLGWGDTVVRFERALGTPPPPDVDPGARTVYPTAHRSCASPAAPRRWAAS
jgi:glycosyltransferase involved in cell wall biosynthesis